MKLRESHLDRYDDIDGRNLVLVHIGQSDKFHIWRERTDRTLCGFNWNRSKGKFENQGQELCRACMKMYNAIVEARDRYDYHPHQKNLEEK